MNKPPIPPDLSRCEKCAKIIGPHGGWFGPECRCALDDMPRRKSRLGIGWKAPTSWALRSPCSQTFGGQDALSPTLRRYEKQARHQQTGLKLCKLRDLLHVPAPRLISRTSAAW